MAESQTDAVKTRNFIPPQLYERFRELGRICTELRQTDGNLETQLRFGDSDIEVFTKVRGGDKPYTRKELYE